MLFVPPFLVLLSFLLQILVSDQVPQAANETNAVNSTTKAAAKLPMNAIAANQTLNLRAYYPEIILNPTGEANAKNMVNAMMILLLDMIDTDNDGRVTESKLGLFADKMKDNGQQGSKGGPIVQYTGKLLKELLHNQWDYLHAEDRHQTNHIEIGSCYEYGENDNGAEEFKRGLRSFFLKAADDNRDGKVTHQEVDDLFNADPWPYHLVTIKCVLDFFFVSKTHGGQ